jgi:hypothetical protein
MHMPDIYCVLFLFQVSEDLSTGGAKMWGYVYVYMYVCMYVFGLFLRHEQSADAKIFVFS